MQALSSVFFNPIGVSSRLTDSDTVRIVFPGGLLVRIRRFLHCSLGWIPSEGTGFLVCWPGSVEETVPAFGRPGVPHWGDPDLCTGGLTHVGAHRTGEVPAAGPSKDQTTEERENKVSSGQR